MSGFLETCFSLPVLPATALLFLLTLYWLLVILGLFTPDGLDLDLDVDWDMGLDGPPPSNWESVLGLGVGTLRFLNIGTIPIMLWGSFFGVAFWVASLVFVKLFPGDSMTAIVVALFRNAAVALAVTKVLTQPLRGKFDAPEPKGGEDLIGREGEAVTIEVTMTSGQIRVASDAAPLLLSARSTQGVIAKGQSIRIVSFDRAMNVYYVEACGQRSTSEQL